MPVSKHTSKPFKHTHHAHNGAGISARANQTSPARQAPGITASQAPASSLEIENRRKQAELLDKLSKVQKAVSIASDSTDQAVIVNLGAKAGKAGKSAAIAAYNKTVTAVSQVKTAAQGVDVPEIRRVIEFMEDIPTRIWSVVKGLETKLAEVRAVPNAAGQALDWFFAQLSSLQSLFGQAMARLGELIGNLSSWVSRQLRKARLPTKVAALVETIEGWAEAFSKILPKVWQAFKKFFGPLLSAIGVVLDAFQIYNRWGTYKADSSDSNLDKLLIEIIGLVVDVLIWVVPVVLVVFFAVTLPAWVGWALLAYAVVNLIYVMTANDGQDLLATLIYRIGQDIIRLLKWLYQKAIQLGQYLETVAEEAYASARAQFRAWLTDLENAALRLARQAGKAAVNEVEALAASAWRKLSSPLPHF